MTNRDLKRTCRKAYGIRNALAIAKVHKLITKLMKSNADLGERVVRALFYTFLKLDEVKEEETKTDEQEVK